MLPEEEVVLLDASYQPIGTMAKSKVHGASTPLHLGFSSYIFNERQQLLLTRRALDKSTWPGVWTNSVCGHPFPGEKMDAAVSRRIRHEMGMEVGDITLICNDFHYRYRDASGIVENEFCPVFAARAVSEAKPNSAEVMEQQWLTLTAVLEGIKLMPRVFSPWMVRQLNTPLIRRNLLRFIDPAE